jgi:hypothetical protein
MKLVDIEEDFSGEPGIITKKKNEKKTYERFLRTVSH